MYLHSEEKTFNLKTLCISGIKDKVMDCLLKNGFITALLQ